MIRHRFLAALGLLERRLDHRDERRALLLARLNVFASALSFDLGETSSIWTDHTDAGATLNGRACSRRCTCCGCVAELLTTRYQVVNDAALPTPAVRGRRDLS